MVLTGYVSRFLESARLLRREAKAAKRVVAEIRKCGLVDPNLLHGFLNYKPESILCSAAGKAAAITTTAGAAIAIVVGSLWAWAPTLRENLTEAAPWLNLGPSLHQMLNFWHSIHGGNAEVPNLVHHVTELGFDLAVFSPLYLIAAKAFIFFGWRRSLVGYQQAVRVFMEEGESPSSFKIRLRWKLDPGYLIVFVGDGDPLADEMIRKHGPAKALLVANRKQKPGVFWARLPNDAGLSELSRAFETADFFRCGGIVLLPVQAQHLVFPPGDAYDIAPDKTEDLLRNIRVLDERRMEHFQVPEPLPVFVVGDRRQSVVIDTFDPISHCSIEGHRIRIDLERISKNFGDNLVLIDPTDVVLHKVAALAGGARVAFRGTAESRAAYEEYFCSRLELLGYEATRPEHIFRMGYNVTDDPTVADPMNSAAVVLTASARDALLAKNYPESRVLYVADLVLQEIETRMKLMRERSRNQSAAAGRA